MRETREREQPSLLVLFEFVKIRGEKMKIDVKAKQPKLPPFIKRKAGGTVGASAGPQEAARKKADKSNAGSVGAPLPGKIIDVKAKVGQTVTKGEPIAVLSSMKLEIVVAAPMAGTITSLQVVKTDMVAAGDLLFEMV